MTFYLSTMLDSDSLESIPEHVVNPYGSSNVKTTSQPIPQRPMASDYPNPAVPRTSATGYVPASQNVVVDRAGGDVQKRTNELCSKIFGTKIYSSTFFGMGGPADTEKLKELRAADGMLAQIAVKMKPLNAIEAIG